MAEKRQSEFTVTDRRRFSSEGDLKNEASQTEPQERTGPVEIKTDAKPDSKSPKQPKASEIPPAPSSAEQKASHDAFKKSSQQLDRQLRSQLGGRAQDFEMTFERFVASLYMSAMMQLGLLREEGSQPRVDLFGARQTIDTLVILRDKTKGNLTAAEANLLSNSLYELQMAYVEVTNSVTRMAQSPPTSEPGAFKK